MDLKEAFERISEHEEKYGRKIKSIMTTNHERFQHQQRILSKKYKIEKNEILEKDSKRERCSFKRGWGTLSNVGLFSGKSEQNESKAEINNLKMEFGTDYEEILNKIDFDMVVKHEKIYKLMKSSCQKASLIRKKKRYFQGDITPELHSKIKKTEADLKAEITKRLEFILHWTNYQKRNRPLSQLQGRLESIEAKFKTIEAGMKTLDNPNFKTKIEKNLNKTGIYAEEEFVQSIFG